MLLIAVFAIYVIVTKRLRITRSTTITGTNARNFGTALLVLLIPLRIAIVLLLDFSLPPAFRASPIPQALFVTIFSAAIIGMAYFFRDLPTGAAESSGTPEAASSPADQPPSL
jgi:hypothetical protein